MRWNSLGFKNNPFDTDPITQATLSLYAGRAHEINICKNVLSEKNVILVVEGGRGVGTTSFANYLRFSEQNGKNYFTPTNEIRVDHGWSLETLLAVIIANIIREIEIFHSDKITKEKSFIDAKALSTRISETFRSFGIDAFGFGMNYGKSSGDSSQPLIVPAPVLGHHLEDLAKLAKSLGYQHGILLQLNNLDIGEIHDESHMKYLFNGLRDYFQTDLTSWMLVGDIGLRDFIAKKVDRLDDIISYEVEINPLNSEEYNNVLEKRILYYKENKNAEIPIDKEVFEYLYKITKGRLRYIFGLLKRLLNELSVGDLTDRVTIDIAKPMILKLARNRVRKNNLTPSEELLLSNLTKLEKTTITQLSEVMKKSKQYISKIMIRMFDLGLVSSTTYGRDKFYYPSLDVLVAYSEL